jgi:Ni,Fe-hydrogenase III large subunit
MEQRGESSHASAVSSDLSSIFAMIGNATRVAWETIPELAIADLVERTAEQLESGGRLCAWCGLSEGHRKRVIAVIAMDADNLLAVARSAPFTGSYACLTREQPQAHLFERELWEQHGLVPAGHPWLKPVRKPTEGGPAVIPFFKVAGEEVHEVAVGPVHAGIIEPGHFRFQCVGEEVLHLEIALGYQHRGIEESLKRQPHRRMRMKLEAAAGDSSIAHATAHAWVMEALTDTTVPLRAQWLRAIALELERLANHTGDLGALANDVAFLPTSAACGKVRGDYLNQTALLCGNRFGRAMVHPGGCLHDLETARAAQMKERLAAATAEANSAVEWLWDASSVRARFEGTGAISSEQAAAIGLVGPAARACGLLRDARYDHTAGWHRFAQIPVALWPGGDVFARARVRWLELQRSARFVAEQLETSPAGPLTAPLGEMAAGNLAVALVEGWRGETCHLGLTDEGGCFRFYKIVDPSFHNWMGLALALRGQAISDFPLCNKSFNLSYCGFDL